MTCKKLKIYNNLRVILDNYEQYIDFKHRAVSNIWSSVDIEYKFIYGEDYKKFLRELKKIRNEYYKAQKSFNKSPISRYFCKDECNCKNIGDLSLTVEREIFEEVYRRIRGIITRGTMKDFNLACENFCIRLFEHNMERHITQVSVLKDSLSGLCGFSSSSPSIVLPSSQPIG